MWGDEFFYWADDFTRQLDDNIRELNEWWSNWGTAWLRWTGIGGTSVFPVPPITNATWRLLVGENPRADENTLRELAEYWSNEASRTAEIAGEAAQAAQGVMVVWIGDGAPFVFQEATHEVSLSMLGLSQTQGNLAMGVTEFVMSVVQAKAAFRAQVILLLFEIVMALAFAIPSLGTSVMAAFGRRAATLAAIRAAIRAILMRLRAVLFRSSLRQLGRTSLRGLPRRLATRIPPGSILRNPARILPRRLPTPPRPPIPPRPPVPLSQRIVSGVRGLPGAARRYVPDRLARTAAARQARQLQSRLVRQELNRLRDLRRAGGRITPDDWARLAQLRSGNFRRTLTRDLTDLLRNRQMGSSAARGANRLGPDLADLSRSMARQTVDNGFTTWRGLRSAVVGYGGRSAVMYGGGGWVIQETITHTTLNSLGVEGYQTTFASLAGSLAGASLGGAPLAFGARLPSMMALGGVGGGLGFYGAQVAELAFTPGADWSQAWNESLNPGLLLRAGGADNPLQAVLQGAVGGAWERGIGEFAELSDSRSAIGDFRRALSLGPLATVNNIPSFNVMDVNNLLQPPAVDPVSGLDLPAQPAAVAPPAAGPAGAAPPAIPAAPVPAAPGGAPAAGPAAPSGSPSPPATSGPPGAGGGDGPNQRQVVTPSEPDLADQTVGDEPPAAAPPAADPAPPAADPPASEAGQQQPAEPPTVAPAEPQASTPPPEPPPPPAPEAQAPDPADGSDPSLAGESPAPPDARTTSDDQGMAPPAAAAPAPDTTQPPSTPAADPGTGAQVGDTHHTDGERMAAPARPADVTIPDASHEGFSDQRVRDAAQSVVDQATQHPDDPAHWKPVEGGWLLQGTHDDASVVVLVDEQGMVQDVAEGSFTGATTSSLQDTASALHSVLPGSQIIDPENAVYTMTLPNGSTVEVQWALDPGLAEGESYVGPASFTLTPAGWQQTSTATIVLSSTVRTDPAEMVRDIHRVASDALRRLEAGLPGPVGQNVPADAGRTAGVEGMRPGDVWQAPATSTSVDADASPDSESAPDAGDRLAAAVADLQSGDTVAGPVVAVTGDPGEGPKLAHFADGSTIAFVIEATPHLAPGEVTVSPATWAFDGQQVRQTGQPAVIRISDQLPGDAAAAQPQVAAMVEAGLRELHGTLPAADRPHQTYNLLDLGRLGNVINPAGTDANNPDRVILMPDRMPAATSPDAPAPILVRLPGTPDGFATEAQAVLDALARDGYRLSELHNGWSGNGAPGVAVRVDPPAGDRLVSNHPIELRLLTPEALDAYQDLAREADRERLPDPQVGQRLADLAETTRPDGADRVHLPSVTDGAPTPTPEPTPEPPPESVPEPAAEPAPGTDTVHVDGYTGKDDLRRRPELVDQVRDGLLPQLAAGGRIPGLEAATPLGDGGLWELTYRGIPVQVWIATNPDLPPAHASVSPGFIEVSSWTASGRKGQTVTAAVLGKALAAYGDLGTGGTAVPAQTPEGPRDPASALANTDAFHGVDPTPESIAHGTVRMEDHPDFPAIQQRLAELGFTMTRVDDHPAVQIRHIVDPDGNLLRVERELQYLQGMRFLDLEHELGHVAQLTERFPEGMPPHQVWQERPDGRLVKLDNAPERMNGWQIRVAEYHVRLEEYLRLAERGADPAVLAEHAEGLDLAHDEYQKATKRGRSPTRTGWAEAHFPEIPALADRVAELRSGPDVAPGADRPAASDDPDRGLPKQPTPPAEAGPGEQLFSRGGSRSNVDVLQNGGEVPLSLDAVQQAAELIGIDLGDVEVRIVTDPEYLRYLDHMEAVAVTPPELGGAEIHLGPASFVDAESLVATIAHEYTHVQQLRADAEASSESLNSLEDAAYASEDPALERFRERVRSGQYDANGSLFSGGGVRPPGAGGPAGPGDGAGGRDLGRDGSTGRGDRGADDRPGGGVPRATGSVDAGAGADGSEPGGRRPGSDQSDLTGPAGPGEQLFSRGGSRSNVDVLHNGGEVPLSLDAVQQAAELVGIDLGDVEVRIVTDPEYLRYLDHMEAVAVTPPELGGAEIHLGPASFVDAESLVATIAHEYTHVQQLRANAEASSESLNSLEDAAYASEDPALERFRERVRSGQYDADGPLFRGAGARPPAPQDGADLGDRALPPDQPDLARLRNRPGPPAGEIPERPGLPGHGGPWDPPANQAAVVAAAQDLARDHPQLLANGYELQFVTDPGQGDLLLARAPEAGMPEAAFRFTAGIVPEGTVAVTTATGQRTDDGVPIYEITVSAAIPEADRPAVARRVVARAAAERLDMLREPGPADRVLGQRLADRVRGRQFDRQQLGLLAELRAELANPPTGTGPAQDAYHQRIGQVLDQLDAANQLDQLTDHLAAAGRPDPELDLVRDLAAPDVDWRAAADAQRQAAAGAAITDALAALTDQLHLLDHGQLVPPGPDTGPVVRVRAPSGETVDLPAAGLLDTLANTDAVGRRLQAQAAAGIAAGLVEAAGDRLGPLWEGGPELAAARVLVRLHDAHPPEQAGEYRRALPARLAGLSSDQLAAMRNEPLPPPLQRSLPGRLAEALLTETLSTLTGTGPTALAARATWRADGGIVLAGRVRGRYVPAAAVAAIGGRLRDWLAGGVDLDQARADLAAVLGAELSRAGRAHQPRVAGALTALSQLWRADGAPSGTRTAAERLAAEILAGYSLHPRDWQVLPQPARDLVEQARAWRADDPYAPLRPAGYQDFAQQVTQAAAALATALAGGTVADPAGGTVADPATRIAELAAATERLADQLAEARAGLDERATARDGAKQEAEREAQQHADEREKDTHRKDRRAKERVRVAEVLRDRELATAGRHERIADAFRSARDRADRAADAYRTVAQELAGLSNLPAAELSTSATAVADLARAAEQAFAQFQQATRATQPVILDTGVAAGDFPFLNSLAAKVNAMVAAQGVQATVRPDELQRMLRANWSWAVSEEGTVLSLGFSSVDVRITFRPGEAVEVPSPDQKVAEIIHAQLPLFPSGSRIFGAGGHRTADYRYTLPLGRFVNASATAVPGDGPIATIARWGMERFRFDYNRGTGGRWSVRGAGMPRFTVPGQVADNRGDSTLYNVDGHYEVQVRPPGSRTQWTSSERVDTASPGDRAKLEVAVEHSYTERASGQPEQLPARPADARFPEHSLIRMTKLDDLSDQILDLLGSRGEVARQQVRTMVRQELPARLDHAINHENGFQRPIYDRGHPVAMVRIKTEVEFVAEPPLRIGTASDTHHLERLRVAFAGYEGATEIGGSRHRSLNSGFSVVPYELAAAGEQANATFGGKYGKDTAWRDGIAAGTTAIRPNIQRYTGSTQAYRIQLTHTVTVQRFDNGDANTGTPITGHGLFRLPESDAYRYGLPVDAEAVRERNPDGTVAALRDDLVREAPPGRKPEPPDYLGPNGIPGAGPALVRNFTGVDGARAQVEAKLRGEGWLPSPLGVPGQATGWGHFSSDPMVRSAEVANLLELDELNAARIEGAYDQAAQDGIVLGMTRHHPGSAPEHLTMRVRIRQDWEHRQFLGYRRADTDGSLDIASHRLVRQLGETRVRSGGPEAAADTGTDNAMAAGPVDAAGGLSGTIGVRRPVRSGLEYGDIVNHVKLIEGQATGLTAVFRVPHRVEVVEVLPGGKERELGSHTGAADLGITADLLPAAGRARPAAPSTMPTSQRVLQRATLLHLDGTGLWEHARRVLPDGTTPGAAAHDHLASFVDTRSLMASPWWLYSELRTDLAVDPRGLSPHRSSLAVRGTAGASQFVGAADLVVADVNLTMNVDGAAFARELAGTGELKGSGKLAEGADPLGGTSGAANADRMRGMSRTSTRIYGRERLTIENSLHYIFSMPVDIELAGTEHGHALRGQGNDPVTDTAPGRTVVYTLSERAALELYAAGELDVPQDQVGDALRRWADGTLHLDRRTVTGMLSRLHQLGIDAGKVAGNTYLPSGVLRAPGGLARSLADKLAGMLPAGVSMPTGPGRMGAGERVGAAVALLDQVADPPVRLPDNLRDALGQGGIEAGAQLTRHPDSGTPELADLAQEVQRLIEELAPGAIDDLPGLAQGLVGQLAGEGWTGKLDRMLDGGWEFDFPVRRGTSYENVTVRLSARLGDGGRLLGQTDTTSTVAQDYAMAQHDIAGSSGWSYGGVGTGSTGFTGPAAIDIGADRDYTGSAWASMQQARIQRVSTFEGMTDRVERDLTVTIEVSRPDLAAASGEQTAHSLLQGPVVHLIPPGLVNAAPAAVPAVPSDAPPSRLPHRYYVESIQADGLRPLVREALSQPHVLGADAVARLETALNRQLSALPVYVGLERMTGPAGHPTVTLPVPGDPERAIQVYVRAEPVGDPRVVVGDREAVGLGQDDRQQHILGHDAARDRALPASRGLAGDDPLLDTGVRGRVGSGESSSENVVIRRGDRDELKIFEEGSADTVAVDVRYTLTIVEKEIRPDGPERVLSREVVHRTTPGRAYITMFTPDRVDMQGQRAEAPAARLRPWLGEPDSARPRRWFGRGDGRPTVMTGAAVRPEDDAAAVRWAQEAYDRFRRDDRDIEEMARRLADAPRRDGARGFGRAELRQIKQHLLRSQHPFAAADGSVAHSRFAVAADIAEAWIRLREGRARQPDLDLLEHELAESRYRQHHPDATYQEAHAHADEVAPWRPAPRADEDLGASWPARQTRAHDQMFAEPAAAELARLGVGEATLSDLGYPDGHGAGPTLRALLDAQLPRVALVSPYEIAFSQRSVNPVTRQRISIDELAQRMRDEGWRGEAIHVVRWGDGSFTSLDNRRLMAARRAGLPHVPVVVHTPNEPLADWPQQWTERWRTVATLDADIRALDDGALAVGDDRGRVRYPRGAEAQTFGELVLFRGVEARSLLPSELFGTGVEPVALPRPPAPQPAVELPAAEADALRAALDDARRDAAAVRATLAELAGGLALAAPEVLPGAPDGVRSFDPLARAYAKASNTEGLTVAEFAESADDLIQFSLRLPDGEAHRRSLEALLTELGGRGYRVREITNLWHPGNRFPGVSAILEAPSGRSFRVEFHTDASWRAKTLDPETARIPDRAEEFAPRQVHAYLRQLAVNRRLGLAEVSLPGLAEVAAPHDESFLSWIDIDHPDTWRAYQEWLIANDRDFREILGEFGLAAADLGMEEAGDQLLRALSEANQQRATGGSVRPGPEDGRRPAMEPSAEGLAVRPGPGERDGVRPEEPEPDQERVPGGSGRRGLGGVQRERAAAGRGHHPLDLPVEGPAAGLGRAGSDRHVAPGRGRGVAAEPAHLLPPDRDSYRHHPVPLSGDQLDAARLSVHDGVVYDAAGRRFDSRRLAPDGRVLFVMDPAGDLYAASPAEHSHGSFRVPVAGAGTMVVHEGELLYLDGESPEFSPPPEYVRQVARALERAGAELAGRVVYPAPHPVLDPYQVLPAVLDAAVDRLAVALDAAGHPQVEGIERLPGEPVRLRLRGRPAVVLDVEPLASTLANRGLSGDALRDAVTGWLDTAVRDALAGVPAGADPVTTPGQVLDSVRRAAQQLATEWTVTAEGQHVAVVRPARGRPIAFRVVPVAATGEPVVIPQTSTRPGFRETVLAGQPALEVAVPAPLLADPGKLDRLVGRALQAHAAELSHVRGRLTGAVHRLLPGRPGPDALGTDGTGRALTVRDEQQVAQLRSLLADYREALPGPRAVIAAEILEQAGRMFKRPGQSGRHVQHQLVAEQLADVDDLDRLLREIGGRAVPPAPAPASVSPSRPAPPRPDPPVRFPAVRTSDGGRTWVAEIPAPLADRAGERDSFAVDALVGHVEQLLRAAADPASWSDGRPPRVELAAPAGIDASVARRLEHVRVPFEARDAAGTPVPRPRAVVTGPRLHQHPRPLPIHPGALAEDLQDGRTFFDEAARERYVVQWRDGVAYHAATGAPLHGQYIFVVEPGTHTVYALSYQESELRNAKHSSFLAGGDVATAGELLAEHGRLHWVDNRSGHYLPVADHLWLARELFEANQLDTAGVDLVVWGPGPTRQSEIRGARLFTAALAEVSQPGEIDGVLRIERVDSSPVARRDGRGVPGAVLRATTTDGRTVDLDVSNVAAFLRGVRPAGEDAAHFHPGYRSFVTDRELTWQAADWLRARIEHALAAPAAPAGPAAPYAGPGERAPRTLSDLDSVLAAMVGAPSLLDGGPRGDGAVYLGGAAAAAVATTLRAVSEQQIEAEVDAAWLPPDRAAALKAALKQRRAAALALHSAAPGAGAQPTLVDTAAISGLRPDLPPQELYNRLLRAPWAAELTVLEAARILDAAHGGHHYERSLAGWLTTPEGRLHHESQVALNLAVQSPRPLPADSGRFRELGEADAARIHAGQGGDWPAPVRTSLQQYTYAEYAIEAYISSFGARAPGGRTDALQIQAGMRPSREDALLHARVLFRELGVADAEPLARLVGQTISSRTFMRASIGTTARSEVGELRLEVEAPAGTRMAWLGPVRQHADDTDLLLAAGTRFQILRLTRGDDGTYTLRVRVVGQEDPPAIATPPPAGDIAATVVVDTRLAEQVAAVAAGARPAPARQVQLDTLQELLHRRWTGGPGQPARGDAFVRGVEPGRVVGDELVTVVHPRRGAALPATVRFGPLGIDGDGNPRRATTDIERDPAGGAPRLVITMSDAHPADDDLLVTLSHELAETLTSLRRSRHAGPNRLVPGPAAPAGRRGARLSPHDLGGVADLVTKVLQLVATTDPAARTGLAGDLEAVRRHLGLDPGRDGRHAAARWRLVDAQLKARYLPAEARRHLAAMHRPGWRDQLVAIEVANQLAGARPELVSGRVRRVTVAADGSLVVSVARRPGTSVRVRVEGATLPAGVPLETVRVSNRSMVVRVPEAVLADPARAPGVVAPAVAAAAAEAAAGRRGRLRIGLRRSPADLVAELSANEPVTGERPRLGARAQGQWAAVTVAARRVVVLTDQASQAPDPGTRDQLLRQRDLEREWLHATLQAWGLLEGQEGAVWRRYAADRTSHATPADPQVAAQVRPLTRAVPEPAAVLASLTELVPQVVPYAGARGAQLVEGRSTVRVILADLSVHDLAVSVDLPADSPRFAVLEADRAGWRLRLRPDAGRAAVGRDVAGALAEAVARLSGLTDPAVLAAEAIVGRLRFLQAWHRVAGPLDRQVILAQAGALVDELAGSRQPGGSGRSAEVWEGGQQFIDRVAGRRRRMGSAEAELAASREAASDVPPAWTFFPGRVLGSVVSSATSIVNGLAAGRDELLLYAQTGSIVLNNLLQAQQDAALRQALYADQQVARHRHAEAAAPAPPAGQPAGAAPAATVPPPVPKPAAWPFYRKRAIPTLVAAGGLGVFISILGGRGPLGMTGALGPLAYGTAYGAADHLAERPEQQARADRRDAVAQFPDGQRNAALDSAYHGAAELHQRIVELAAAGRLGAALTDAERAALIEQLGQARTALDDALAALEPQERQYRDEVARRRRLGRLLLEATVLGPSRLGWMAIQAPARLAWQGIRVPVRAIGQRMGVAPAPSPAGAPAAGASLPAGMAPASHYAIRMTVPGFAGAVGYSVVTLVLDPASFNFVTLTGLASIGAGVGLGGGWATQRSDEVDDELALAAIRAANDARDALHHIEQSLAELGDPDADPDGRPPADRSNQPADSHAASVVLLKHGPAFTLRLVAIGAAGPVLIPGQVGLLLLTGGSQATNQAAYGVGEAIFRKLTAGVTRRFHDQASQQHAQQLALTPLELAELVRAAAEEADQAGPTRLHHQRTVGTGGPRVPMNLETVSAVAAKYGIDIEGLRFRIRKDRTGYEGSTGPNQLISLTRDAFRSELTLAITLVHERFHVDELRSGMRYPQSKAEGKAFEDRAYAHEEQWWAAHPLNPANRSEQ